MKVNYWPLESWGRVRVMLYLLEQTGFLELGWESKEYNYSQIPIIYKKYQQDSDYPLNIILKEVSVEIVMSKLIFYLNTINRTLKVTQNKLLIKNLTDNDRQSIESQLPPNKFGGLKESQVDPAQ